MHTLHYDIHDDGDAKTLRDAITDTGFDPPFTRLTESVYTANLQTMPPRVEQLVARIRALLPKPHPDTRVFLAVPSVPDGKTPTILNVPVTGT